MAPRIYRIFLRMPMQEAPLRIFRTFICIKRNSFSPIFMLLPLPFTFFFPQLLSVSPRRPFPSYSLSESTSTFCSFPSILGSVLSSRISLLYIRLTPLHCNFQPFLLLRPSVLFATHCLSTLCVFSRNSNASSTLEYLFFALNFVLQVTILPRRFSLWRFSHRYSTLLLFLINACVCYRVSLTLSLYFSAYGSSYTCLLLFFFFLYLLCPVIYPFSYISNIFIACSFIYFFSL